MRKKDLNESSANKSVLYIHNNFSVVYKSAFFSEIEKIKDKNFNLEVVHIYQESSGRKKFGGVPEKYLNYRYIVINRATFEEINIFSRFMRIINFNITIGRRDVVVLTGYYQMEQIIIMIFALIRKSKIIFAVDSHVYSNSGWKNNVKKIIFKSASGFMAYGTSSKQVLMKLGVREEKIYGPFATTILEEFVGGGNKHDIRDIRSSEMIITILYVGRFSDEKNVCGLLEAYLKSQLHLKGVQLRLVGSGEEEEKIRNLAKGINSISIIEPKWGIDLTEEYKKCDFFVLPSKKEAWGLVLNEALQAGKPILVSSACGSVVDLVDENTGLTFISGSQIDFENKMIEMCGLVRARRYNKEIVINKISKFSVDVVAGRFVNMINSI